MSVPVLSKYAASLKDDVKQRYGEKIAKIGIDPVIIPEEELDPECLPPIEQSDLFSFLVLETSYYTNEQFKNYKNLEAYNQVVSGFVASVRGKLVSQKHVVVAKVRHSQRMRHRAGRIGASVCGAVYHTDIAQPSQSLIQSICYPHLYKLNTKAVKYGCKYEESAIKAYEQVMKEHHVNFELKRCGLFINKEYPYINATPDFLVSCDCRGLGCGEVKCPISIKNGDFEEYSRKSTACLENVNGKLKLKRTHNYYYQVQQQLFTLPERKYCDFVVFSRDSEGNSHIVCDRIDHDTEHSKNVMSKLEVFWKICILPEMLGSWYTRRCDQPDSVPDKNAICFCRGSQSDGVVSCSNADCPYGKFHKACLALENVSMPKKWYCPHCCKLAQFKKGKKSSNEKVQATIYQAAIKCNTICICNCKAPTEDRLIECHNTNCKNGRFFHLSCLGLKRMPNNSKTTWLCLDCRAKSTVTSTTTSTSTSPQSPVDSHNRLYVRWCHLLPRPEYLVNLWCCFSFINLLDVRISNKTIGTYYVFN